MSQSSIQRLFNQYLKSAPTVAIRSKEKVHLLIDGSYFANGLCLILYYDYDIRYVQLYRETNQEKYKEIKEDLEKVTTPVEENIVVDITEKVEEPMMVAEEEVVMQEKKPRKPSLMSSLGSKFITFIKSDVDDFENK